MTRIALIPGDGCALLVPMAHLLMLRDSIKREEEQKESEQWEYRIPMTLPSTELWGRK